VRGVAVSFIDVPPDFLPLAEAAASIFFTAMLGTAAVGVYATTRRVAKRPERTFRWIAAGALVLSFLPDLWLLSEPGGQAFPGATPTHVVVLMVLHTVAAAVIVPGLTLGSEGKAT
jgi:Family of unknown function (DUF6069)